MSFTEGHLAPGRRVSAREVSGARVDGGDLRVKRRQSAPLLYDEARIGLYLGLLRWLRRSLGSLAAVTAWTDEYLKAVGGSIL